MKIEKLPSGSFRIRQQIDGRRISITLPYKPSKKEAAQLINDKRTGRDKLKLTFNAAALQYIEGKRNTLSPSTIRGYESIRKNLPASINDKCLGELTAWDVQKYISDISKDHSPKTIRNHHGFISAVLATFNPDLILRTNLPQKIKSRPYLPTESEIQKILAHEKGTEYEIAFKLAARYGLRRSEICALETDDLNERVLTIDKAVVQDENYKWVKKTTKTTSSTRTIVLDQGLCDLIKSRGYIYKGNPHNLYDHLQLVLKQLGITPFPFHMFRHYYVSYAHALGFPNAVIISTTGHKTDYVMTNVYREEMREQVTKLQTEYADKFHDHI